MKSPGETFEYRVVCADGKVRVGAIRMPTTDGAKADELQRLANRGYCAGMGRAHLHSVERRPVGPWAE